MKKPIKIYTLFKTTGFVVVVCALWVMPVHAADNGRDHNIQASSCAAAPCPLLQKSDTAARTGDIPQQGPQRTAGTDTEMSPALALAMALGLRNVQGPVERSHHVVVRSEPPVTKKQAALLSGDGGTFKKASMNAAGVRLALEN